MLTATSGSPLHEVIRGFEVLLRKGWKLLRTSESYQMGVTLIINVSFVFFGNWDVEEVVYHHCSIYDISKHGKNDV